MEKMQFFTKVELKIFELFLIEEIEENKKIGLKPLLEKVRDYNNPLKK